MQKWPTEPKTAAFLQRTVAALSVAEPVRCVAPLAPQGSAELTMMLASVVGVRRRGCVTLARVSSGHTSTPSMPW